MDRLYGDNKKEKQKDKGEKMYKKNINLKTGLIIIFLLTSSCSVFAVEDSNSNIITMTYSFAMPVMQKVSIDGTVYDQVNLDDAPCSGDPGLPSLPAYGASLLIPYGTKVEKIDVVPSKRISLGTGFVVPPVGEPVPLSQYQSATPTLIEKSYNSKAIFHGELFTEVGIYSFRGYNILILKLHPVQYVPSTGELFYYKEFVVSVETSTETHVNSLFRGLAMDIEGARGKVDNPAVIDTYAENTRSPSFETYDLLVVTTEILKNGFEPLKQVHNTVIKTLDDIGSNDLVDIRNYIRDAYLNWSIEYVLIGGDDNIVPVRKLWVNNENIPSDLYYACLDGSYNSDGDTRWGEPTDGENGSDVDLIAEVYVGRACVGSATEVDHFINKTLAYMNKNDTNHDVWLVGEHLGFGGVAEYAGYALEELINGTSNHGYTTVGIPNEPDKYPVYKLFDRDWPGYNWPKSEIIAIINDGVHIINHLGHGNTDYAMKMSSSDADALMNDKHCFVYSQTCLAGHFDMADCFAEHMNVKTEHGAFALVMNSREGWGRYYSTDGPSQRYNREFWDAVFGENITVISKANQDSKEDNIYRINDDDQIMRWVFYELNLFGDPMVGFGNSPPEKPQKPVGAESGNVGENYLYTTTTTDSDGNLVYYQWNWGDNLSEWSGPYNSGEKISTAHRWDKKGTHEVRVKAKDTYDVESNWSDPLSVTMPQNQGLFMSFFEVIEHYFPRLFSIINVITGGKI